MKYAVVVAALALLLPTAALAQESAALAFTAGPLPQLADLPDGTALEGGYSVGLNFSYWRNDTYGVRVGFERATAEAGAESPVVYFVGLDALGRVPVDLLPRLSLYLSAGGGRKIYDHIDEKGAWAASLGGVADFRLTDQAGLVLDVRDYVSRPASDWRHDLVYALGLRIFSR